LWKPVRECVAGVIEDDGARVVEGTKDPAGLLQVKPGALRRSSEYRRFHAGHVPALAEHAAIRNDQGFTTLEPSQDGVPFASGRCSVEVLGRGSASNERGRDRQRVSDVHGEGDRAYTCRMPLPVLDDASD
jgi:hypothetical protein